MYIYRYIYIYNIGERCRDFENTSDIESGADDEMRVYFTENTYVCIYIYI